jgi:hypothetical protein
MMVIVEEFLERELAGKIKVLEGNMIQCHFIYHKSHIT